MLIQVSPKLAAKLPEIEKRVDEVLTHSDLTHASAHVLKPALAAGPMAGATIRRRGYESTVHGKQTGFYADAVDAVFKSLGVQ